MTVQNQATSSKTDLEELQNIINRATSVISALEGSHGWDIVLEDMQALARKLDDSWQYIKTDEHFTEARITKMAVVKVINLLNDYKHDKMFALSQIESLTDKRNKTSGDYDGETKED